MAVSGPGLLAAAAVLMMAAAMLPEFMWADDRVLFGEGATYALLGGWEQLPGLWLRLGSA